MASSPIPASSLGHVELWAGDRRGGWLIDAYAFNRGSSRTHMLLRPNPHMRLSRLTCELGAYLARRSQGSCGGCPKRRAEAAGLKSMSKVTIPFVPFEPTRLVGPAVREADENRRFRLNADSQRATARNFLGREHTPRRDTAGDDARRLEECLGNLCARESARRRSRSPRTMADQNERCRVRGPTLGIDRTAA
jgi:hypothetical protein